MGRWMNVPLEAPVLISCDVRCYPFLVDFDACIVVYLDSLTLVLFLPKESGACYFGCREFSPCCLSTVSSSFLSHIRCFLQSGCIPGVHSRAANFVLC